MSSLTPTAASLAKALEAKPKSSYPAMGHNILLEGGSGTGKTYSIRTLVKAGIEVRALFLEPRWKSVADISCEDGLHIHYVNPTTSSWDALELKAKQLTQLPWEAALKWTDPGKSKYDGFMRILNGLHRFKCLRCGEDFGDATEWDSSKALWLDGLSGLNTAALQMVTGGAVVRSLPQWGAAMEAETQIIKQCIYGTQCWFILVAHLDKLVDEINGGMIIQPNALGRKVGPELPKDFDEVILTERVGGNFKWTTVAHNVDLKVTYLPLSDNLPPDFTPIYKGWSSSS